MRLRSVKLRSVICCHETKVSLKYWSYVNENEQNYYGMNYSEHIRQAGEFVIVEIWLNTLKRTRHPITQR